MDLALILICSALSILFSMLRRVYSFTAGKNLFGEELESGYQRTFTQISNNKNLINIILWALIVVFSSINLILIENYSDSWLAVFIFAGFISAVFIYLANYQPSIYAKIRGATMVASLSTINFGVSILSLPQVIFSLGTAPE